MHANTKTSHLIKLSIILILGMLLNACAGESESAETNDTGESPSPDISIQEDVATGEDANSGQDAASENASIASLEPGWNEILPEGDTVCSRGSEFAYFVHNGTSNKLVLEFEGGGACWTDGTCSVADAIFDDSVEDERLLYQSGIVTGFLDHEHENHPFPDWHHIFIPYCTGDVHIGNSVHTYGEGDKAFTINHNGANNVRAVLDWAKDNIPAPEVIFMTGCSAGAYGSVLWVPHVAKQYPDAKIYQLGDSGCGVITQSFLDDSFPIWNGTEILPTWIESLHPDTFDVSTASLNDIYTNLAEHYSTQLFSQFTTIADNNQTFYFEAMGGSGVEAWTDQMLGSLDTISESSPNFRKYIAPGDKHCIIPYPEFYTLEVGGIKLVDWIINMTSGIPIEDVVCEECTSSE